MTTRTFAAFTLFAFLAGCLEREETLTIHDNGAVTAVHRWTGERSDFDGGAARLPDPELYRIERGTRKNANGDEEHVLTATAEYRAAADMPTRYGPAEDPLAGAALRFHTDVQVRRDGKRVHYVFTRRYDPRSWAHYRHFWRKAFPRDVEELVYDENLWRRPIEDRRRVVHAVVDYTMLRSQYWAEQAMAEVAAGHPRLLEAQLAVRQAIAELLDRELATRAAERVVEAPVQEIDEWSARLLRQLDATILTRARVMLALDDTEVLELTAAMALLRHDFDVSHDLEDESFVVRLELPGRVSGHNGDGIEDGHVVWRFDGESLRDRPHVLVATSVREER